MVAFTEEILNGKIHFLLLLLFFIIIHYLLLTVPYPAIFWGCQFFDEHSEEINSCVAREFGRCCKLSSVGSRGEAPGSFGYFTFWNRSKHRCRGSATTNSDNLSIFRIINFYTLKSLGVWVWDLKPVLRLQNSSVYVTGWWYWC